MTKTQITQSLETRKGRIALAEAMVPAICRHLEESTFGFVPPKTKKEKFIEKALERKLKDILEHQIDVPSDVHEEISMRPWDFI